MATSPQKGKRYRYRILIKGKCIKRTDKLDVLEEKIAELRQANTPVFAVQDTHLGKQWIYAKIGIMNNYTKTESNIKT